MCMKSSEEPRSPTPHPRQGYLFEKEEEDGKKKEEVGRKMTVDSKRQAIYGALFGKRAGGKGELTSNDSDSEEDLSIAPVRLNGR